MAGRKRDIANLRLNKAKPSECKSLSNSNKVYSVCENVACPHQFTCLNQGLALFHILGRYCSRTCAFCSETDRKLLPPDPTEPRNVALAVKRLNLKYAVIKSFSRNDLKDNGANHIALTVNEIHEVNPDTTVEVIIHDSAKSKDDLKTIIASSPEVIAHNVRTVPRLHPRLFDNDEYDCSLDTLLNIKTLNADIVTKSGLMLGLGENNYEVLSVVSDVHDTGCSSITIGQYLPHFKQQAQPSRYVAPWEFFEFKHLSMKMGYSSVRSGPFTCSSFDALNMYREIAE